jgi:hypothetical protein
MQRKRELVQVIIVLLVIVLVGSSCFSTKSERTNGGKNRQKLAFIDTSRFLDVSVEVQKLNG